MAEKRYMNDKGEIRDYGFCMGVACCECPNDRSKNGFDESCNKYMDRDSVKWHKNLGWREIFELENYTDEYYVMNCENEAEAEVFARFLDKNGRTWYDKRSYIKDDVWRRGCGTGFIFNQGFQTGYTYQETDYQGNKYIHLNFKDYVFKMEDKKMEKKQFTVKDLKAGMRVQHRDGSTALLVPMDDGSLMKLYATRPMWGDIRFYDEYLNKVTDHNLDIMKVFPPVSIGNDFESILTDPMWMINPIWTREENVKEMTVAEIEKELGYSIKVVK